MGSRGAETPGWELMLIKHKPMKRSCFSRAKRPNQLRIPVGADAKLGAAWKERKRPTLFVLVVGETARARNFA